MFALGIKTSSLDFFVISSQREQHIGGIDHLRAFSYLFQLVEAIDANPVFLQFSILFTTVTGVRQLRILNLSIPTSGIANNIFRFGDADTAACLWIKDLLRHKTKADVVRFGLDSRCRDLLIGYRSTCATATPSMQVIPCSHDLSLQTLRQVSSVDYT
jgi:hypothetical protein